MAHHVPSYYSDRYGEHYAPLYDHYGVTHHYYNNKEEENPISASFDISGTFGGKKNAEQEQGENKYAYLGHPSKGHYQEDGKYGENKYAYLGHPSKGHY